MQNVSNFFNSILTGFHEFQAYASKEARLHPIAAIASMIFVVPAIAFVCYWGARRAEIAKNTAEEQKINQIAQPIITPKPDPVVKPISTENSKQESSETSWTDTALKVGAISLGIGIIGLAVKCYYSPEEIVSDAACVASSYGSCAIANILPQTPAPAQVLPGVCTFVYNQTSDILGTLFGNTVSIDGPYAIANYIPPVSTTTQVISNVFDVAYNNSTTAFDMIKDSCLPLAYGPCAVANYVAPSVEAPGIMSGVCEFVYNYSSAAADMIFEGASSLANYTFNNSSLPLSKDACLPLAGPYAVANYVAPTMEGTGIMTGVTELICNHSSSAIDVLNNGAFTVINNSLTTIGNSTPVSMITQIPFTTLEKASATVSANPGISLNAMASSTVQKAYSLGGNLITAIGYVGGTTFKVIDKVASIILYPLTFHPVKWIGAGGAYYYRNNIEEYYNRALNLEASLNKNGQELRTKGDQFLRMQKCPGHAIMEKLANDHVCGLNVAQLIVELIKLENNNSNINKMEVNFLEIINKYVQNKQDMRSLTDKADEKIKLALTSQEQTFALIIAGGKFCDSKDYARFIDWLQNANGDSTFLADCKIFVHNLKNI